MPIVFLGIPMVFLSISIDFRCIPMNSVDIRVVFVWFSFLVFLGMPMVLFMYS